MESNVNLDVMGALAWNAQKQIDADFVFLAAVSDCPTDDSVDIAHTGTFTEDMDADQIGFVVNGMISTIFSLIEEMVQPDMKKEFVEVLMKEMGVQFEKS
jgi:predicted glutamine amidotransferase